MVEMAKAKTTPAQEKDRTPLGAFVHHQGRALEETGKALVSLLPKDFRTHAGNAMDECRASFNVLFDGVIDTVEGGLGKLRTKPKEDDSSKVKVEVE
jgi:hypothetical protein